MNNSPTQLTVHDLAAIKVIIDTACSRGAFRADEMRTIGEMYDKLVAFLSEVVAASNQTEANNPQPGNESVATPNPKEEAND